jgi:uncharacterized protein with FMN-binding domain
VRRLALLLSTAALALPPASAVGAIERAAGTERAALRVVKVIKVVGPGVEADRWGTIKVTVLIRRVKDDGKLVSQRITKVVVKYPESNPRTYQINSEAVPILVSNTLLAQSSRIDALSAATDTSIAFQQSLDAALKRVAFVKK